MRRLPVLFSALLLAALPALAQPAPPPFDTATKTAVVQKAALLLIDNYIYPDRGEQAAKKISDALAAGDYAAITDPASFAARLTADLQSVTHDKHMHVAFNSGAGAPPPSQPPRPQTYAGFQEVSRLKGNIGYINQTGFPPTGLFTAAANDAMRLVAGTDALIIDLRQNGGGDPESVAWLCSFFFDSARPVHVNDLIFRKSGTKEFTTQSFHTKPVPSTYLNKPVYLLTSAETFSGGEEFANNMKVLKRARLVGAVTGGGANPTRGMPLPGQFMLAVPNGRAENPVTKSNWEGTGVTPDIIVPAPDALRVAMRQINPGAKPAQGSDLAGLREIQLMVLRTTANPAAEAALRQMIGEITRGQPDYARFSPQMAEATRNQLPTIQPLFQSFGALKSITFLRIDRLGADLYDVTFENGRIEYAIFLSPEGKIVLAGFRRT